jgi:hypothetical protein
VLDNNEIRTLGTRILPWPMEAKALSDLRTQLLNCTLAAADREDGADQEAVDAEGTTTAAPHRTPMPTVAMVHPTGTQPPALLELARAMGDDTTPLHVPRAVLERCPPVMDLVRAAVKQQTKYKYVSPGAAACGTADGAVDVGRCGWYV